MAKPDLQGLRVTPAGAIFRDDGKLPLVPAFDNLLTANGPGDAVVSGVPIGGIYVDATTSGINVRLA
jgi:hypothetical protein